MLSDEGKEFNNNLIQTLNELFGINHPVTSPYKPNTNGLTEKYNQQFIHDLRIHAENNPNDWPLWVDFVLMAYRNRQHSSTKFTPYSLMFGREMNEFAISSQTPADYEAQVLKRNMQIKDLIENTRPLAITNIQKQQKHQLSTQNKAHNIVEESIAPDTNVMVKSLKLVQKKLAPKYYGPYEVISKTPKGNYFLRDRTKKQLPKAIPRARLKIAPDFQNNGPYLQIDKILKDRINKGVKEYYVKWKGYPDSENSWEPEQNFSNIECLEDYNDLKS
jgi:hypothetical protein